jgi:hypothetical protein
MIARWCRARASRSCRCWPVLLVTMWAGAAATAEEPRQIVPPSVETARVTVPPLVVFEVTDLTSPTQAFTGTTTVSFDQALLAVGRVLRISVKADGDLIPQDGDSLPISSISWNTSGVVNGIGVNGVLSKASYTQVFQSNATTVSGQVDLAWTLSPPSPAVRAGTHQVTLRWRIESVIP